MQLQQASDDQLFARARRGDRNAFAGLVERHQHALVGYLIRLAGDRDRAEDVAQETFLRLLERGKGYRAQGKLKAYLYRIATNLVRSEERQLLRRQFLASTFLRLDRGSNPLLRIKK